MSISPLQFFALVVIITAASRLLFVVRRRRRQIALQELAREWRMHYSPYDRFELSRRIAEPFPLPGASEVRVVDLIYGTEGDFYRFIFSAEFTAGVTRGKHRMRRVVTFREPRARSTRAEWSTITLAPEGPDLIAQYKALHAQLAGEKEESSSRAG